MLYMYTPSRLITFALTRFIHFFFFFFSSRRRHTRSDRDWSSDVCSSDLDQRSVVRTDPQPDLWSLWTASPRRRAALPHGVGLQDQPPEPLREDLADGPGGLDQRGRIHDVEGALRQGVHAVPAGRQRAEAAHSQ